MAVVLSPTEISKYRWGGSLAGSVIGPTNGTGFDTQGLKEVYAVLYTGDIGALGRLNVKVQESDDNGVTDTWTDVSNAIFTEKTPSESNKTYVGRFLVNRNPVTSIGRKRWIRLQGIVTTAVSTYGGGFMGIGLQNAPVLQEEAVEFNIDETTN